MDVLDRVGDGLWIAVQMAWEVWWALVLGFVLSGIVQAWVPRSRLEKALGGRGPYVLQAAIAVLHADEPQDWRQLAALYGELARRTGSSVVELNQAAAIAEAGDVEVALDLIDRLELDRYHYLHATRADLLRRLDRVEEARAAYERALELVHSDAERRFLERRLAELER